MRIACAVWMLCAAAAHANDDGATLIVTLKESAQVSDSWVKLGDVARLSGLPDAQLAEIAEVKLSHVPLPGVERIMEKEEISERLRRIGIVHPVVFASGAGAVRVTAAVRNISGHQLVDFGMKFLNERVNFPDAEVSIERPAIPAPVRVPDVEIQMKAEVSSLRLVGLVPVAVEVWAGDKRLARRLLSYRVHVRAPVVHATRDLTAGAVVSEEDIAVSVRDLSMMPEDVLMEGAQVVGQKLARSLAAGSVLRRNAVARSLEVRQGGQVILLARVGSVEARAEAVARSAGSSGDLVTVMNKASKRLVQARVIEEGVVEAVLR